MDGNVVATIVDLAQRGSMGALLDKHEAVLVAVDDSLAPQFEKAESELASAGIVPGTATWQAWANYESLMLQLCDLHTVAGLMIGSMVERPNGMLAQILIPNA